MNIKKQLLMGLVYSSIFFAIISLATFQFIITYLTPSNNIRLTGNNNSTILTTFLNYWDKNLGILLIFLLIILINNNNVSLNIIYAAFCLLYYYNESAKMNIKLNGTYTTIIYPLSWYIKTYKEWTIDYLAKLNFKVLFLYNAKEFSTKLKSFFSLSLNDILVGLFIKEPKSDENSDLYQSIYEFQKMFFKYKKPVYPKSKPLNDDDTAAQDRLRRIRDNNDPRIMLNKLRRFPLVYSYNPQFQKSNQLFIQHILTFYTFLKTTLVALLIMVLYFLYTIFFFKLQFLKQLSVWFIIGMLFFWLISGFNFFLKRYQFGKFTGAIQRFWKRTNTCFWLIEGFLILIFFYYYLNSSQEPVYMYDYSSLNQEYLISLQTAGLNIIVLSLVIYFMYFTLLRLSSNSWVQLNVYMIFISTFIFFSFFIETYQFYYVISTFNERLWVFNEEENLWVLDIENPILRNKHQYLLMCLIAKYWHFLFIFLSWVFFLIKSFERRKYTFVLFGANLQNIVLLYVLNFACYLQWFKWFSRRFLDSPYTWFMTNIDTKFIYRLYFEIKLLLQSFFTLADTFYVTKNVLYKSLNFWSVDSLALWKFI